MTKRSRNPLIGLALALAAAALAPAAAEASAPSCSDLAVGVPHNAATPIHADCTGGTNDPVIRIVEGPDHGTLDIADGADGADLWVSYRPEAGYAGNDSFTYRGVSLDSGPGETDEPSAVQTVSLKVAAGSAPVCSSVSQSVPQATLTKLRLLCASGGDPINIYTIVSGQGPAHGTLGLTSLNSGLLDYTSVAGFAGADAFKYTATSTCGAASCGSNSATYDLMVLNPQQGAQGPQGPTGPIGPIGQTGQQGPQGAVGPTGPNGTNGATGAAGATGATGAAGANGKDGAVVTTSRLMIASFLDALSARSGKPVLLRYVSTTGANVILEVFKRSRRVAAVPGRAREGRNTIRWNGKAGGKAATSGRYKLVLRATSGVQVARDSATVRVTGGPRKPGGTGGGGGGGGGGTGGDGNGGGGPGEG